MAYTFGGASTDLISWTANATSLFTTNRASLITCWVYPTTLTATRKIWSAGATWRLEIDTTTSSCRFVSDNTTDGVFTFPAGLALNTWTFIAVFVNCGAATPVIQVNAWTATTDGPIVQQTVTVATAPVGGFTTSNLVFGVGNTTTTPALPFQGDIASVCAIGENASSAANQGMLGVLADGVTSQGELDSIASRLVVPLWRGDVSRIAGEGSQLINEPSAGSAYSGLQLIAQLETHLWTIKPASGQGIIQATLAGAVASARRSPRPMVMASDNQLYSHANRTPLVIA